MAKKNYDEAAQAIIRNVGGRDNVDKVIHCITRLRFYLKDEKLADTSAITQIPEVAGAIYNGALGQYQVVIGPAVADVYDEVVAQLGDGVVDSAATEAAVAATQPTTSKPKN
ncbi:PTS glucose/sucrose transporter subunit IIB [Leuconostoc sp.]